MLKSKANLADTVWKQLGITPAMVRACALPWQQETNNLVDAGEDMFGRPQQMAGDTSLAWQQMQSAAEANNIQLLLVSAFRSVEQQSQIIQRRLDAGQHINEILKSSAIPGFSEHHTGCAIDLHDGEGEPLSQSFDERSAFDWLTRHAESYGFTMTYPRNNEFGMIYEPWHWRYQR